MEDLGKNVRRLRLDAGWATPLDAYTASGVKPATWESVESRPKGPQGHTLGTLERIRAALSDGLGRRVTLDELVSGSASDARDAARHDRRDRGNAAAQRRQNGNRRSNQPRQKGE